MVATEPNGPESILKDMKNGYWNMQSTYALFASIAIVVFLNSFYLDNTLDYLKALFSDIFGF